ncbi:hypothetical protein WJX72_009140 [[Myrmecia] bisecta]|uniref:SGNH hydrolase-type esterase domain-containing protein n=1 Tax=[Myrmecia] bisecta TaxID=41462 RepID=A0AAW1PSD8_9CHLO
MALLRRRHLAISVETDARDQPFEGEGPMSSFAAVVVVHLALSLLAIHPLHAAKLVVFGDSLSDNGSSFAACGSPPSPPYYMGRYSNGPIWVDQLASTYNLTSYLPKVPGDTANATVYVIVIGSNDIAAAAAQQNITVITWAANEVVANTVAAAAQLVAAGARNIVALATSPILLNNTAFIRYWDTNGLIQQIVAAAPASTDVVHSCLTNFTSLLVSPGMVVGNGTVCPSPETHIWWDGRHPSTRIHTQVASDLARLVHAAFPGVIGTLAPAPGPGPAVSAFSSAARKLLQAPLLPVK